MRKQTETSRDSGAVVFIPLNKLKKSPKNARKIPHSEAEIEALAASIAAKGLLQNLVVEPERNANDRETGCYLVSIGEGRRLAQLLRAKRKEIKKTEPIRCVLDTANDAHEISLAENVIRTNMHPADQFEAFKKLAEERALSAEDIAARFGVTPQVVRQRLRLAAVSPTLMQVYRNGGLSLEQLMAFAITDDHARQEQVFDNLSYNKDASIIRRMLTETHVSGRDRRARFVGTEAYEAAGGAIVRDLFSEDYGGYFADAGLLDWLVREKLQSIAADVRESEGWKWAEAHIDYPHAHGMRRVYPHPVSLSPEDEEWLKAVQAEFDALTAEYEDAEELPDDVDAKFGELEAEIERLAAKQEAYEATDIGRSGVFVVLNHDGTARLERGFVRPGDEQPTESDAIYGEGSSAQDGEQTSGDPVSPTPIAGDDEPQTEKGLSDLLVCDLTAHRTLGLRVALGESPDVALLAMIHALVAQTFFEGYDLGGCLSVKSERPSLAGHADGIEDTAAAKALADRHGTWARQLPRDVGDLWPFIVGLDADSRMALFAHCIALTVNAVRAPWDKSPRAWATADAIAEAVGLDMTAFWTPTVRSYFGRVSKARILEAVREAASDDAAAQMANMKKQPMAEAAEQLLTGTGWLPELLRTGNMAQASAHAGAQQPDAYPIAAE
ncbi:MAG TPA: ParB N-terminal domain-containing protein [Xanthobacteraceae bacterium]|nr:ParB N-terminal domain-containing protein [Xanthobacteraceae bacterium]